MKLSAKQNSIGTAMRGGKKVILLEGPMGTSKTYAAAVALHTIAMRFPGSIIFVGRKNMSEIRKGTIMSFREAAHDMGLVEGYHYNDNKSDNYFEFLREAKGSFIYFTEMDHTKDPQFFKLKSANVTCAFIDEADGVVEGGFHMLNARVGRANKNGAPDFVMMACNANEGWIKTMLYDKFKEPEKYGPLPDDTVVIEFTLEDSFLPDSYYIKQMRNPQQWVQRYLYNNWNFGDDLYSLFKYRHMDSIHVPTFNRGGLKTLTIDAARTHDRTVGAKWEDGVLTDIQIFKDLGEEMDYDDQARLIHDYVEAEGIGWENIWVDAVGEGQGLIVSFKTLYGWRVNSFVSNAKSESKTKLEEELKRCTDDKQRQAVLKRYPVVYKDLRSEQGYLMSFAIEHGDVAFWDGCPYLSEFKKEATMHNTDNEAGVMRMESKQKVKERSGHSPDIFDCVLMGFYAQSRAKAVGSYAGRRTAKATGEHKHRSGRNRPFTAGWRGMKF